MLNNPVSILLALALGLTTAVAHDHLPAAATAGTPGATLQYAPTAEDFTTTSSWVFGLNVGTTNDAYNGYYWTDDLVFSALAATPLNGGQNQGMPSSAATSK
jgi:hypothetical protein